MEKLSECPVCNSQKQKHFLTCTDYTVSKKEFDIVECIDCGFKFTNPRPLPNELGPYYQSEDYISHSNTSKGIVSKAYKLVRQMTLVKKLRLTNRLSPKGAVLDIGCGTGEFLNICKSSGRKTVGVEPDLGAREQAKRLYGLDVFEENHLKQLNQKFSIITMWHVLEHVPTLNERVEEVKNLLTDTGYLIVAVPNCESHDAKKYGKFWAAYDVPRHLYHFRPKDIKALFANHDMKVTSVLPMVYDSFYVSLLSEKYMKGQTNYLSAAWTGLLSNIKANRDGKSFSSQIYIITKN